jgi:hypothetical protein
MDSMRKGDWPERLRAGLGATAEAQGWPAVSYPAPSFASIDAATGRRTTIVMSGVLSGTDPPAGATIAIGPGPVSWEDFLRKALYHDVMAAMSALDSATARRQAPPR